MKRLTHVYRWWVLSAALALVGCGPEVVIYSAHDQEFSEPILDEFERQSGVRVLAKYDVESTKTVGLVNAIIQEQNRPRCDVFWNNEILHTLRLKRLGLLDAYVPTIAESIPAGYRSPDGLWYGFAARARVLIVNTVVLGDVPRDQWPDSIHDLVDPRWKDQVGIARPLFGTTATHAAVLFAELGDDEAREFFRQVHANARVVSGNKQVALDVARGRLAWGITDTDDAMIEVDKKGPVEIIYPDQNEGELGTLFIPNTLCIIRGGPNEENARRLIDYLLSTEIEDRLAEGPSAQFPVIDGAEAKSRAAPDEPIRWMKADFEAAADQWDTAAEFLRDEFAGG
jgi:iron(III) transport system substrate-binding protein